MRIADCPKRPEVVRAVRTGLLVSPAGDELRAHARACADCSETARVAAWLASERERAEAERELPDAGLVYWKAQILARRKAAERAAEPILCAERVAGACAGVGLVCLLAWQRHGIGDWLRSSSLLTIASVGAALLLTALAFYFVRAEE